MCGLPIEYDDVIINKIKFMISDTANVNNIDLCFLFLNIILLSEVGNN